MYLPDFLVIGSGCTGAMAAQTLAEAGHTVLIIDGGQFDTTSAEKIPHETFESLRRKDESQEKYFLGDKFESLPADEIGSGAQLTPARNFLTKEVDKYLPMISDDFFAIESLAVGGLGGGWGLGCCVFNEKELIRAGLNAEKMNSAYQVVADRIGMCGEDDDARKFTSSHIKNIQPAPSKDIPAEFLQKKFQKKQSALNANGFHLGRPALALLTQDKGNRKALDRRDMDFYDDHGHSAYRAWMTVAELKTKPNVTHEAGWLVTKFRELENSVEVTALRVGTNEEKIFSARKLILAAGPLGTARVVLRSVEGGMNKKLPLLCNPYNYTPFLIPRLLGQSISPNHLGLAQLSLFHDRNNAGEDIAMASLYSYHSLMLFRLLRETPLNFRDGRIAMKYLLPAMVIAGIHHPETEGENQFLHLQRDNSTPTQDVLVAKYELSKEKISAVNNREAEYRKAMRKLGAWAIKQVKPGNGASVHYAGVLPFSEAPSAFAIHASGRLHNHQRTFVADGSGFKYLPAKGLTLSLMANAHNVAGGAMKTI
mgnify:CR=1 FL=1